MKSCGLGPRTNILGELFLITLTSIRASDCQTIVLIVYVARFRRPVLQTYVVFCLDNSQESGYVLYWSNPEVATFNRSGRLRLDFLDLACRRSS